MEHCGKVSIETAADAKKFAAIIKELNLKPPVLIKPNWGTVDCYTEADILDWTLSAIPGAKLVIESHGWARNEETLLKKPASGLTKANLRRGNSWFLDYSGIRKVLEKHQVEYLNLTEEVWAGRIADPALIRKAVEASYAPVQFEEQYAKVPQRVYDLRGGTLLSLAKHKIVFQPLGVSLSVKNLFGLVPGPSRGKYHGKEHSFLDQSIVDINKIYRSLFSVKGIIEVVHGAGYLPSETETIQITPECGKVFASEDTVTLDAFATVIGGCKPEGVGHLRLAAQTFGAWDVPTCTEAVRMGIRVCDS